MKNVNVKVINLSKTLQLPKYESEFASGMDVMACFDGVENGNETATVKGYDWFGRDLGDIPVSEGTVIEINPGERALIPTGLKVEIPEGYEIQVRPRSGLALKKGVTVLNTPGTIDSDYRGVIGIIIINHGNDVFAVNHGDKIAQIVLNETPRITWDPSNVLSNTERGEGGFGHTSDPKPEEINNSPEVNDGNRVPQFQVGDKFDGVGEIKDVNLDPISKVFIYDVLVGDEISKMSEQEITDMLI